LSAAWNLAASGGKSDIPPGGGIKWTIETPIPANFANPQPFSDIFGGEFIDLKNALIKMAASKSFLIYRVFYSA